MYKLKNERICCIQRSNALDRWAFLKLDRIALDFIKRAWNEEGLIPERWENWKDLGEGYLKLERYISSFEFFQEVESLWFYHYKDGTDTWEKALDHIYKRSITPIHEMN